MRVVLFSFQGQDGDGVLEADMLRVRECALEAAQTLALALHMRKRGRLEPFLVCRKGSFLHWQADALQLPLLALSRPTNPLLSFLLWRKKLRRSEKLLIVAVGEDALKPGVRLFRRRRMGDAVLAHAFFLRGPRTVQRRSAGQLLAEARHILCGSGRISDHVRDVLENLAPSPVSLPILDLLPPGIDTTCLLPAHPQQRFIFGMGAGFAPHSGAATVVRAMAAIWQRDDVPPWEVRILGDASPYFREILEEAERLGVQSRLSLLDTRNTANVLTTCRAWIAPGLSPDELPETLWHGFVQGVPVIASASPLHLERLGQYSGAALIVPESDPQALAGAMIELMRDAELRVRLVENGKKVASFARLTRMAEQACAMFEGWVASMDPESLQSATAKVSPGDEV